MLLTEGLQLDKQRSGAFHADGDDGTGCVLGPLLQEKFGWVADGHQASVGHFEDTDLIGRPEPVFRGSDNSVVMMTVALEIENGVDDVLESLGPRDRAFLGNVADQENRRRRLLREKHELRRDLSHLRDAARSGLDLIAEHGLDRINDDEIGPKLIDFSQYHLQIRLGQQEKVIGLDPEAFAAHFYLTFRLFAGNVQNASAIFPEPVGHLHDDGGFTDARSSADKNQRAGDDPAPENTVEFADARFGPVVFLCLNACVRQRCSLSINRREVLRRRGCQLSSRSESFFHERVVLATIRTLAKPFPLLRAAILTDPDRRGCFGHR